MPDEKKDNVRLNPDEKFLRALARLERKRLAREHLEQMIESGMDDPREDR